MGVTGGKPLPEQGTPVSVLFDPLRRGPIATRDNRELLGVSSVLMTTPGDEDLFDPGQELAGKYRIVRRLGKGAMGEVYEAEHVELRRRVALKVLLQRFFEDERMRARFMQEARSAAAIRHPGIVEIYDLGVVQDITFIVMELLEGEELIARVKTSHPLPVTFVLRVGCDLADAVAAAHDHGVIHRDLKPHNVFLARQGRHRDVVKVLDFGLAKDMGGHVDSPLTRTTDVFGTPTYMSPEQLRNAKHVDARADIYAIGCILYEALAGVPPFRAKTLHDLVLKIVLEAPPPLDGFRSDVPPALAQVIGKALAKQRGDRYPTALELLSALERCSP